MKTQNKNFVTIQNGAFVARVLPHNIAKTEAALAKVKPPKAGKSEVRQTDAKRYYPAHRPEMTTAEYIAQFWKGNARIYGGQYAENGAKLAAGYSCANYHAAPAQYDPAAPLCVESVAELADHEIICAHCGEIVSLCGLIGENADGCPCCGKPAEMPAPKAKAPRISKQAARVAELLTALDVAIVYIEQITGSDESETLDYLRGIFNK